MTYLFLTNRDEDANDPVIDANNLGEDGTAFGEGTDPIESNIT